MHWMPGVGRRVVSGIRVGLFFAVAFSAIATILFALSGGRALGNSFTVLGSVIAVYAFGGIVSGSIFGLLRPLARWAWGAAILGSIVAVPAYAGMLFATKGPGPWTSDDTSGALLLSILIGSTSGIILRHRLMLRGWRPQL